MVSLIIFIWICVLTLLTVLIFDVIAYNAEIYVLCGKKTPVWHCKNALKDLHPCTFLFCNQCKEVKVDEIGDHRPKRAKAGLHNNYDDNDKNCDHNVMRLEICDEGAYFEENYVNRKLSDKNCYYPTKCLSCGGVIRDRIAV